jgi:hypothetical protein
MKITQAMKSGSLTNPRINCKNLGQSSKEYILQFQVLAATFSASMTAGPRVAQGIPPHVNRSIEGFVGKESFE